MRIILSHFIYFQGIIHVTNVWLPPIYLYFQTIIEIYLGEFFT